MKKAVYIGIFFTVVLFLLFSNPILSLYNKATLWNGIPVSLLFIFSCWICAVIATYFFSNHNPTQE